MGLGEILLVGLGALLALVIAWTLVTVFRRGSRDGFITWRPFGTIALYTFGVLLIVWGLKWAANDPDRDPFVFTLVTAATFFVVAATFWFAGFFYGRWRRERQSGVITRGR